MADQNETTAESTSTLTIPPMHVEDSPEDQGTPDPAETTAEDTHAEQVTEAPEEAKASGGKQTEQEAKDQKGWDKQRQQIQQEIGNKVRPLEAAISEIKDLLSNALKGATPAQKREVREAAETVQEIQDEIDAVLAGDPEDLLTKGQVAKIVTRLRGELKGVASQVEGVKDVASKAHESVSASAYWSNFAKENPGLDGPKLWGEVEKQLDELSLKGEARTGAAHVLWKQTIEQAKQAAKESPDEETTKPAEPSKKAAPKSTAGTQIAIKGAAARNASGQFTKTVIDGQELPRMWDGDEAP